jgi:hypothetical protein
VSTHPNIYTFLELLKSIEIDSIEKIDILIHSSTIEIKRVKSNK